MLPGHVPQSPGLEPKIHKKKVKKGDESRRVPAKGPVGSGGSWRQEQLDERDGRLQLLLLQEEPFQVMAGPD